MGNPAIFFMSFTRSSSSIGGVRAGSGDPVNATNDAGEFARSNLGVFVRKYTGLDTTEGGLRLLVDTVVERLALLVSMELRQTGTEIADGWYLRA